MGYKANETQFENFLAANIVVAEIEVCLKNVSTL